MLQVTFKGYKGSTKDAKLVTLGSVLLDDNNVFHTYPAAHEYDEWFNWIIQQKIRPFNNDKGEFVCYDPMVDPVGWNKNIKFEYQNAGLWATPAQVVTSQAQP